MRLSKDQSQEHAGITGPTCYEAPWALGSKGQGCSNWATAPWGPNTLYTQPLPPIHSHLQGLSPNPEPHTASLPRTACKHPYNPSPSHDQTNSTHTGAMAESLSISHQERGAKGRAAPSHLYQQTPVESVSE